MRKKKKTKSEKRPFTSEKGKNQEKKSEKRKNPEEKNKQTNKQTRSEKRPFKSEKGKNPRKKKKKSETERERRSRPEWVALKCQRGPWVGGLASDQSEKNPGNARPRSRATWVKKPQAACRPSQRAAWVLHDLGGAHLGEKNPGSTPHVLGSSGFFFFLLWVFSDMFWVIFYIYRGWKSSLRDLISTWSLRGKICHIGPHQTMEIESQKLDL